MWTVWAYGYNEQIGQDGCRCYSYVQWRAITAVGDGWDFCLVEYPGQLRFTYTYPYGAPPGCCGGYYDDPDLSMLNDKAMPAAPSTAQGIEWGSSSDFDPVLDLGGDYCVARVVLHYIVYTQWGKYAPRQLTLKATSDLRLVNRTDGWMPAISATDFDGVGATEGSFSKSVDTSAWQLPVRYIMLDALAPSNGGAVASELEVFGTPCTPQMMIERLAQRVQHLETQLVATAAANAQLQQQVETLSQANECAEFVFDGSDRTCHMRLRPTDDGAVPTRLAISADARAATSGDSTGEAMDGQ